MLSRLITEEEHLIIDRIIEFFHSEKMENIIYTNSLGVPDIGGTKKNIIINNNSLTIVKMNFTPVFYIYLNDKNCGFDNEDILLDSNLNLLEEVKELIDNNINIKVSYTISS